jgi:hypothetical protein
MRFNIFALCAIGIASFALTAAAAPPPNDNFSSGQVISGANGTVDGTNVEATTEAGENNYGVHSIWYRWTAPSDGEAIFDTNGSDFDTKLYAATGDAVDALDVVDQDDDNGEGSASRIQFTATAGTLYHIRVSSFDSGDTGLTTLSWSLDVPPPPATPPPNDNFADGQVITGSSGTVDGTNVAATTEEGENNYGVHSIWYRWTAPASGEVVFDTDGSDFDTKLYAATGNAVNALDVIEQGDDNGESRTSRIQFTATAGTLYHIRVSGFESGDTGLTTLSWSLDVPPPPATPPPNDNFANGQVITGPSGTVNGTNVAATTEAGENNYGVHSIWYRWTAPSNGIAIFDTNGSEFDTKLYAATGSAVNALTVLDEDDDGGQDSASRIRFTATAGDSLPHSRFRI